MSAKESIWLPKLLESTNNSWYAYSIISVQVRFTNRSRHNSPSFHPINIVRLLALHKRSYRAKYKVRQQVTVLLLTNREP